MRPAVMHPQHLNRERKSKQTRTNQPNQTQVLTNGAINSLDLKMSLDTAMFLADMQTIQDWDIGVST